RASDALPNEPGGADSSCRESARRFSSSGTARLARRLLRNGRLNTARAVSPFVVALGTIGVGIAQVTASSNASSHMPSAFTLLSLPLIFEQSERREIFLKHNSLDLLKWIFASSMEKMNIQSNRIVR
ncbi:hypothetical protein, partial [Candidatus Binatus sp.]|uniref:hypothetical protein n=1 Tax=Candidatus Binatus sp. TaxID=2811406 RepID=UPI003CC5AEF1